MTDIFGYHNYSYVGDTITLFIAVLCGILILSARTTERNRNFRLFIVYYFLVVFGAFTSIIYHILEQNLRDASWIPFIYVFRTFSQLSLLLSVIFVGMYLLSLTETSAKRIQSFTNIAGILYFIIILEAIAFNIAGIGLSISDDLVISANFYENVFWPHYFFFAIMLSINIFRGRKRFVTRIFKALLWGMGLNLAVIIAEMIFQTESFTCVTFILPVVLALFFFHFSSFNVKSGGLNAGAFEGAIRSYKNHKLFMIYLYLPDMNYEKQSKMSDLFYHFNEKYYYRPIIFEMGNDRYILITPADKNKDIRKSTAVMLHDFDVLYHRYEMDYKIIMMYSSPDICEAGEYLHMEENIEKEMEMNSVYTCTEQDFENFKKSRYILSELADIARKHDLDDPRILAYCQPVLHTTSGHFSTAEALMRLNLEKSGMVFPDQFIHLAEDAGYIHILSMIILNKTCKMIHEFMEKGYHIDRISVNISMLELHDEGFCAELLHIIRENNIPYSKIAIEFTESKNEKDFHNVTTIMGRLNRIGIKFYLDDFGTDYSNLERITRLPFDIVKFDRSLTIISGQDEDNLRLVSGLARIMAEAHYQILFEGVETEEDVARCTKMGAKYLQGYNYSKPIPIERMEEFMIKEGEA